jgi:hypothetical protein
MVVMNQEPKFPAFKLLELEDRSLLRERLAEYAPNTSEWTFTNLFIWRSHYRFRWTILDDWVLLVCEGCQDGTYGLQPIGPPSRLRPTLELLFFLKDSEGQGQPYIDKADDRLVSELLQEKAIKIEPVMDDFDYVYLRDDLVRLAGNRYRAKRNHINKLLRNYGFTYEPLGESHIEACLALQDKWCRIRRCREDLNLLGEWEAVREVLKHFSALEVFGGVILLGGEVGAFTVGERLNNHTAVIHIEKADPEVSGLYPIMNHQFCLQSLTDVAYVNREQDLGVPGLREAKLSYHPHHFERKYRITLL